MSYNFLQWLTFFYIYCFCGWCFESAYVSLKQRHFVNRGFLKLPMLPIYGSGAVAILIVTIPVRNQFWLVWLFGMLSATLLELVTGAVMESLFKVKYWDYSNQKLNFKGYICLSSSIAWGFLSILLTEVLHEPIEAMVLSMPLWLNVTLAAIVSVLFVSDFVVSFKAAWDLRKLLEKLSALREQAEAFRQQLEQRSDEFSEKISAAKAQAELRWDAAKEEASERWNEAREEAELKWRAAREEAYARMSKSKAFFIRRLLKDNPYAASGKFGDVLEDIRDDIKRRHAKKNKSKG